MILSSVVTIGRTVFSYPHILGWKIMFVLPELTWPGEAASQGAGALTASMFPWLSGKSAQLGTASSFCFLKRWGWAYSILIWDKFSKEASNSICSFKILHSEWWKYGDSLSQNCLEKEPESCDFVPHIDSLTALGERSWNQGVVLTTAQPEAWGSGRMCCSPIHCNWSLPNFASSAYGFSVLTLYSNTIVATWVSSW